MSVEHNQADYIGKVGTIEHKLYQQLYQAYVKFTNWIGSHLFLAIM